MLVKSYGDFHDVGSNIYLDNILSSPMGGPFVLHHASCCEL